MVPYCFETDLEEKWYNIGLKHGLEIADEHPKSPWISVKDDLPCNHKELLLSTDYLKIELYNHEDNDFHYYLGVRLTIDGEEIDSSVKYEVEL